MATRQYSVTNSLNFFLFGVRLRFKRKKCQSKLIFKVPTTKILCRNQLRRKLIISPYYHVFFLFHTVFHIPLSVDSSLTAMSFCNAVWSYHCNAHFLRMNIAHNMYNVTTLTQHAWISSLKGWGFILLCQCNKCTYLWFSFSISCSSFFSFPHSPYFGQKLWMK